jgi:hypothetical protein
MTKGRQKASTRNAGYQPTTRLSCNSNHDSNVIPDKEFRLFSTFVRLHILIRRKETSLTLFLSREMKSLFTSPLPFVRNVMSRLESFDFFFSLMI